MRHCYLTLKEISVVIGMTPVSLTYIIKRTGESKNPKNIKIHSSRQAIAIEHDRKNKKAVEINRLIREHKITNFKDIDYTKYLFVELKKEDYITYFGDKVNTKTLRNSFKLTANTIKKIKENFNFEQVETGINGLRGRQYEYVLSDILDYLPDKIYIKKIDCICYKLSEVYELLNKNGIEIKKITLYRNVDKLPAIKLRKDYRVMKPVFDEMLATGQINVHLKFNPKQSITFYSDSECTNVITHLEILPPQDEVTVYVKISTDIDMTSIGIKGKESNFISRVTNSLDGEKIGTIGTFSMPHDVSSVKPVVIKRSDYNGVFKSLSFNSTGELESKIADINMTKIVKANGILKIRTVNN